MEETAILYLPGLHAVRDQQQFLSSLLNDNLKSRNTRFVPLTSPYHALSVRSMTRVLSHVLEQIRTFAADCDPTTNLVLAGHSLGGLVMRRIWLQGLFAKDPLDVKWASRVRGFVLLASPDRGVHIHRLPSWQQATCRALRAVGLFQRMLLFQATIGADFLTNLRLDWLRLSGNGEAPLPVVQILGTSDGVVSREDCLDNEQFANASIIDLAGLDHAQVAQPKRLSPEKQLRYVDAWTKGIDAILSSPRNAWLADIAGILGTERPERDRMAMVEKLRSHMVEWRSRTLSATSTTVVFLIHGIRASNGDWPAKLQQEITRRHPDWKVLAPSYGRFSALRFSLPWLRKRAVHWLKDHYTTQLQNHRDAKFHFVGHSNGTYAAGWAIQQCSGIQFDRLCLVGSVLPSDYPFDELAAQNRVGPVRVDCSDSDWPVGLLCAFLRGIGMKDVGVAGLRGFDCNHALPTTVRYHRGGHGRPLDDDRLSQLADFLDGQFVLPPALTPRPLTWLSVLSRFLGHPLAARLLLAVVVASIALALIWIWTLPYAIVIYAVIAVLALIILIVADSQ